MGNNIKIPKVSLDGARWSRGVFTCPFCNETLDPPHHLYLHIVGLADTAYGQMKVVECPHCFEKYYSHASKSDIMYIQAFVDENQHLKHLKF